VGDSINDLTNKTAANDFALSSHWVRNGRLQRERFFLLPFDINIIFD
jgi:hypothetical protein